MSKTDGLHNIVKRLHTIGTHGEASIALNANINYLNKNCKFLSYVEKEKLTTQLRNQDPHTELLISSLREENAPKEHAKTVLYAFIYPKQANKKSLEALNHQLSGRLPNNSAMSSIHKPKQNVSATPNQYDYSYPESFQSSKDSKMLEKIQQANIVPQRVEVNRYDKRGKMTNLRASTNKDIFGRLQRLVQGSHKGYFDASKEERRGFDASRSKREEFMDPIDRNRGVNYSQTFSNKENPRRYAQNNTDFYQSREGEEYFTQNYSHIPENVLSENTQNINWNDSNYTQDFEGTSPDFLLSLGLKSYTEVASPNKSYSISEAFQSKDHIRSPYQKSKGQNSNINTNTNDYRQAFRSIEREEPKEPLQNSGYYINLKKEQDVKINGVSEKANEVINSLLGDLGNSGIYHSLMKKLEEKNNQQIKTQPTRTVTEPEQFNNKKESGSRISSSPFEQKKTVQNKSANIRIEEETVIDQGKTTKETRDIISNEFSVGGRTEKYVSVNMIKRFLESNEITAEDIVDEVFRYFDGNFVNKNYFVQVMSNYLNCVPHQHPQLQIQDIVQKMFEVCDKNGDGIISSNDLGSGVTLFSQLRTNIGQERKLYKLLDPHNKGFVTENDFVSVLKKATGQESELDNLEEISEQARKIMTELDKEKKGIITYWDIFLWKDSDSYFKLLIQLNNLLEGTNIQAPTSLNSNQGFSFELYKRSIPKEEPSYVEPGIAREQASSTPLLVNRNASPYYLQSPAPNDVLQNLSPFDSVTKGTKTVDLTLSPQSESYTPYRELNNDEPTTTTRFEEKNDIGEIRLFREEIKPTSTTPTPNIYIRDNQFDSREPSKSLQESDNMGSSLYKSNFEVSNQNNNMFDLMSNFDLPFSGPRKFPENSKFAEIKSYLQELERATPKANQ